MLFPTSFLVVRLAGNVSEVWVKFGGVRLGFDFRNETMGSNGIYLGGTIIHQRMVKKETQSTKNFACLNLIFDGCGSWPFSI